MTWTTCGSSVQLLLRAFVRGTAVPAAVWHESNLVDAAIARGLGPVAAHVVASSGACIDADRAVRLRAVDLTARLSTRQACDLLAQFLDRCRLARIPVLLLKGAATSMRYYPAPHLRGMGDLDVLVPAARRAGCADALRAIGFEPCADGPPCSRERGRHSTPFRHRETSVWVDLHVALHPGRHPLARARAFLPAAVAPELVEIAVAGSAAYVMNDERQLVYTCSRWAESLDARRGLFGALDAALILAARGGVLDWDRVRAIVDGSWAARALRLMLVLLHRWQLAPVPPDVVEWLAARDSRAGRMAGRLLQRLADAGLLDGRDGWLPPRRLEALWSRLAGASPARVLVLPRPCRSRPARRAAGTPRRRRTCSSPPRPPAP